MKNPWVKKNPFMSLWLSGANRVAGKARGQIAATIKRESAKASREASAAGTKQVLDFWRTALGGAASGRKKRR